MFDGILEIRDRCPVCDLNLGAADTGDGAAAFIILIESTFLVALAFWVEFRFNPPLWSTSSCGRCWPSQVLS